MIGGMSGVTNDVVPFSTVMGNRAKLGGLNIIGLKRNNFNKLEISNLRKAFKYIFFEADGTLESRVKEIMRSKPKFYTIKKILSFLNEKTKRSFCMP